MSKKTAFIISSILWVLSFWILYGLNQPIEESTEAISKTTTLEENSIIKFRTKFDYGHELNICLINEIDSLMLNQGFRVIFKEDNKILTNKKRLIKKLRYKCLLSQFFIGNTWNDYEIIIKDIDSQLIGKKISVYADVTGGGPSVGIAYAKALEPEIWKIFWGILIIASLFSIYGIFKKASR